MGQRSRKRRAAGATATTPRRAAEPPPRSEEDAPRDRMARGYARSRERDDAIRATLEPYTPGERPAAIKVATGVCALIAVANPVLYLAGWEVRGSEPHLPSALAICVVLAAAAVGMWQMRYWAVLGFEVILGITLVFAGLSLLVPSNWEAVALAVGVMAVAGWLFWKLIRVMARIQLPSR